MSEQVLAVSARPYPFAYAGKQPVMDPKERFYRQFHQEINLIQTRIKKLGTLAPVGGERQDAKDSILASISKLALDVSDALDYIPAHDQRNYSESVKALTDQLDEELARLAPKVRFQFKKTPKKTAPAAADPRHLHGVLPSQTDDHTTHAQPSASSDNATKNYNAELADHNAPPSFIRKPSFSSAREIFISGHEGLHIILPMSASRATASGNLTELRSCIVDMSAPTGSSAAFLSLMLKNLDRSLIVAGHVRGPVHMTGLHDCIIVVAARQVRIHECRNVDVYLFCGSRPIIEDCSGMRFAPLPQAYMNEETKSQTNHWEEVDDFKWLKADHSPNWSILPEDKRLPESVWTGPVAGEPSLGTEAVLREVGLGRK